MYVCPARGILDLQPCQLSSAGGDSNYRALCVVLQIALMIWIPVSPKPSRWPDNHV